MTDHLMPELVTGDPVFAAPWNDGRLPMMPFVRHRFSHREPGGLAVTLCGVRQESRFNAWVPDTGKIRGHAVCQECERLALGRSR